MTEAYIYDAARTPRGKGRADGSLHEVTSLCLSAQTLDALQARTGLPPEAVMPQLLQARQRQWLQLQDRQVRPTALGRRFANDVIALFL